MKATSRKLFHTRRQKGFALVIVLAFVVLLTAVVVAFFSTAIAKREISNSSVNQEKADILANSALDVVVGNLKQEIANGSAPPTGLDPVVTAGGKTFFIYHPLTQANAVPLRSTPFTASGTAGATPAVDPNPNFIRESSSNTTGDPYFGTPLSSLASRVNSLNDPSLGGGKVAGANNGRRVTAARWNSHFLMPRFGATSTDDTNPDGTAKFVPPDWVLVSRNGPAQVAGVTATVSDPNPTNANYVVGRYAYVIYNEGGLLDMNAAGFPTATGNSPNGFTQTQVGQKGSLALADLTQLPVGTLGGPGNFPQSDIDKIINWRNAASGGSSAGFGSPASFAYSNPNNNWYTNFADASASNSIAASGFRRVYATASGLTDQAFTSRQELLKLQKGLKFDPNALLYMGTFSRALEQPSYVPPTFKDSAAPKVISGPFTIANFNGYTGGNTGFNGDKLINPSFLTVRATSVFVRLDGTKSVIGEPLVKRKFALNNLQYITLRATAQQTNGDPIYDRFGLSRTSASSPWVYNHGISGVDIGTLAQVQAAGREPDFAELLKAAIQAGSLGKTAPANSPGNEYHDKLDTNIDYHVLQIMANLIDQYDADSIPTRIQVTDSGGTFVFSGVEDLPYLYRLRPFLTISKLAKVPLGAGDQVTVTPQGGGGATYNHCAPGTIANPQDTNETGQAVYLLVPEVWNPNDSTPVATSGIGTAPRPTQFRVTMTTTDPTGSTTPYPLSMQAFYSGSAKGVPRSTDIPSLVPPQAVTITNPTQNSVEFQDPSGLLYREPTMLWSPNAPVGSQVAPGAGSLLAAMGPVYDQNTSPVKQRIGLLYGALPINFQSSITAGKGTTVTYKHYTAKAVNEPPGNVNCIFAVDKMTCYGVQAGWDFTVNMDYKDPTSGTWVTYSQRYLNEHNLTDYVHFVSVSPPSTSPVSGDYNYAGGSNGASDKNITSNGSMLGAHVVYDPRSTRFGVTDGDQFLMNAQTGDPNATPPGIFPNPFPEVPIGAATSANAALGGKDFTIESTQRPALDRGTWEQLSALGAGYTYNGTSNQIAMRFAGAFRYYPASPTDSYCYSGLLTQNPPPATMSPNPNTTLETATLGSSYPKSLGGPTPFYYEDCDGITRRAMGGYIQFNGTTEAITTMAALHGDTNDYTNKIPVGLPMATANKVNPGGTLTPKPAQMRSRPLILNRPFKSVMDMSYAFSDVPWKNIDFFTVESGDAALLDTFCISEPPSDAIVAGKVDLNTHQGPVLAAVMAGAYRDELYNPPTGTRPVDALSPLNSTEVNLALNRFFNMTLDVKTATASAAAPWHGPLSNISELVGRYVTLPQGATAPGTSTIGVEAVADPIGGKNFLFSGLPKALDNTVYTQYATSDAASYIVQRFREAALRPLADCGQTRVWNLMIDVIAQTGHYPKTAGSLADFIVEGEKRYWLHVAIDRMTGQVIDRQLEPVTE